MTTDYHFRRSSDGKVFWYPNGSGHAWCSIQYVHIDEDNSGALHFYVAETKTGGTHVDIELAMRLGHTAFEGAHPSLIKMETLNVFHASLVPVEVDALFGNSIPSSFWADWQTLSLEFDIDKFPERLIPTLNLVYAAIDTRN